jgi:uncharacterized RmlC-like cupin family protein
MRTLLVFGLLVTLSGVPTAAQRRGAGGAAASRVTFAVFVTDPSGAPISNVKVTLTGPAPRSTRTEGGRAVFENLPRGAYKFRFERDGFAPLEREVDGRGSRPINVKVVLAPAGSSPPPLGPVAPLPPSPIAIDARSVVLDLPAFIEKNYVGRAASKSTPIACAAGASSTLIQINEPISGHTHPGADEFVYVIAGQGGLTLGDRTELLNAGVFVLVPRGVAHAFTPGPKKPLVFVSTRAGEKCAP